MARTAPIGALSPQVARANPATINALIGNDADHESRIAAVEAGTPPTAPSAIYGWTPLDSYAGATDDDKLTAALAYAQAQTYKPTIVLSNRAYTFATPRTLVDGFRLRGPWGYSNAERGTANMACQVTCNGGGTWLTVPAGTTWDVSIGQLCFKGSSTTQWIGGPGLLYCCLMRDLSFSGFSSVLGSQATKLLMTACQLDGWWEVNNSYHGAIHLGGSDDTLFPNGCLLDSATAFYGTTAGNSAGQSHLWCDYLEKSYIGPMYITAEGNWGGVRVTGPGLNSGGSNLGGPVWFGPGLRVEGRNAGAPCNGALIRVEGGIVDLRGIWASYAMANPSAFTNRTPVDAGVIQLIDGQLNIDGATYDRATGVAESVPFVHQTGGELRAVSIWRGSKGGAWTGRPQVVSTGGTVNPT